jgi:hypothetical protein
LRRASSWSRIPLLVVWHVISDRILFLEGRKTHEDDDSEPTGREQQVDPALNLRVLDVEARGDDAGFVEAAVELDDDFARAVVVDDFEFVDVTFRSESVYCGEKEERREERKRMCAHL